MTFVKFFFVLLIIVPVVVLMAVLLNKLITDFSDSVKKANLQEGGRQQADRNGGAPNGNGYAEQQKDYMQVNPAYEEYRRKRQQGRENELERQGHETAPRGERMSKRKRRKLRKMKKKERER